MDGSLFGLFGCGTPEALPSSCRAAAELAAARRARESFFGNVLEFAKNRIRTLDPEQRARGETHQAALLESEETPMDRRLRILG